MTFAFLGEVMLRLAPSRRGETLDFCDSLHMTPGGSEANTAVALQGLGGSQCVLLSAFADNSAGENCLSRLRARGLEVVSLPGDGERMGLYWYEPGIGARAGTVIYDRADSAFDRADPAALDSLFPECDWFHSSGVTPGISRNTSALLLRCLDLLPESTPFSFDLNYRSRLWRWTDDKQIRETYAAICKRADLVIGNCQDFHDCLGLGSKDDPDYDAIAAALFEACPRARYMGVNLRTPKSASTNIWSGLLYARSGNGLERYQGPRLELDSIVDRLGAGDAFTAGLLHGLSQDTPGLQETIDLAVGVSAMKHAIWGDFITATRDDVLEMLLSNACGNIRR